MKSPTASRLLVISSLLLFFGLSAPVQSQTRNRIESLPKLLSVREQQAVRESWLKKRLETMLLPMMRQQKIEMWIVTNEEFHADPVTRLYRAANSIYRAGAISLFSQIVVETNSIDSR